MRSILAVTAVAIGLGGLPAVANAQTQALSAPGFTTQFPGDWTHVKSTRQGVTLHTLMSPGTVVPNKFRSIPKSGGIAVTVSIMSASHYKRVTLTRRPSAASRCWPRSASRARPSTSRSPPRARATSSTA